MLCTLHLFNALTLHRDSAFLSSGSRLLKYTNVAMDHLHYRLNFDLDKNFITA